MRNRFRVACLFALGALLAPAVASAASFPGVGPDLAPPRVPVSLLARPLSWFDPSRLQIGSSVSVGSGFGGGAQGLQVTSLTYRFEAPLVMRVRVGNAFGPGTRNGQFFLEGLDLRWRPSANTFFQVQFQDVRSPLQLSRDPYGFDRAHPGW
uniref:Uncharacterized protein n=1 Tax=Eiseniibacteriota bacterium TaxID=2212470 RepID=A0A832MKT2_UNCEI